MVKPFSTLLARDIMVRNIIALRPEQEVCDAIGILLKNHITGAPVVDQQGRYLGLFSEKSSLSALLGMEYENIPSTEVRNFIDAASPVLSEEADLLSIADIFLNEPYRRLPVIRNADELVGLVCRYDVLKAFHSDIVNRQNKTPKPPGGLYLSSVVDRDESPIPT